MNLYLLGCATAFLAAFAFIVYMYRKKQGLPLIPDTDFSRKLRGYPTECPCGCGLKWAGDMPYPPHYATPPSVTMEQIIHQSHETVE